MCSHTNIIQGKKNNHREKENLTESIFEHVLVGSRTRFMRLRLRRMTQNRIEKTKEFPLICEKYIQQLVRNSLP